MNKTFLVAASIAAISLAGCATSTPTLQTGPDAEVSFDGLSKVDGVRADELWVKADVDLTPFTKVMLVGTGIEYRPGGETSRSSFARSSSGPYEVSEDQKARLAAVVAEIFVEEVGKSQRFELVGEPGPDVLLVKGRLMDVISYVPPEPSSVRSDIFIRSVGEATLVLEVRDSVTEAILARAIDRRAAERPGQTMMESNRPNNTAEVRRMVRRWATSLRELLDELGS